MQLTDLSPRQLDRLIQQAQSALEQRRTRAPIAQVRQMLKLAALQEGYTLDEVFPEFEFDAGTISADDSAPKASRQPTDEPARTGERPAADTKTPEPAPTRQPKPAAPVGTREHATAGVAAAPRATVSPEETQALRVVAALAARGPLAFGTAVSLDALSADVGDNWGTFYAALETAVRRGWVHFRGNAHCALTDSGLAAFEAGGSAADRPPHGSPQRA